MKEYVYLLRLCTCSGCAPAQAVHLLRPSC
jgi:hypothetical protein